MPESESIRDIGFAKLDFDRCRRTGLGETVYAPGKTKEQLAVILQAFRAAGKPALTTRCTQEQYEFAAQRLDRLRFDAVSRVLVMECDNMPRHSGRIAVCTGGTADIPVAEEAARTVEFFGATVDRYFDVGVAGLQRLLNCVDSIRQADVVIAVAGMEGALGSVIAGLVEAPVIAVPTSVGYGASFGGLAPLLSMLNSCAEGMSVVNIDNGFGAGVLACRMIRIADRKAKK
ncbi:MAG: nickel pincer cofactor biosynthesis protein LarB [Victivallaceae bacterium]|nr:nickel pincer cofactor biosynthesis protein LarB [Victivallaceae bacterium]